MKIQTKCNYESLQCLFSHQIPGQVVENQQDNIHIPNMVTEHKLVIEHHCWLLYE